jgi:hypothetical protein
LLSPGWFKLSIVRTTIGCSSLDLSRGAAHPPSFVTCRWWQLDHQSCTPCHRFKRVSGFRGRRPTLSMRDAWSPVVCWTVSRTQASHSSASHHGMGGWSSCHIGRTNYMRIVHLH